MNEELTVYRSAKYFVLFAYDIIIILFFWIPYFFFNNFKQRYGFLNSFSNYIILSRTARRLPYTYTKI